jgi:hypothetical protein
MWVTVFPERERVELGAKRWQVEWWTLKPSAVNKPEPDFVDDLDSNTRYFKTRDAAVKAAPRLAEGSFFGATMVVEQCVDCEDGFCEWKDIGTAFEIKA